ncbi:MAG: hypothetical protein NTV63_01940 [Candidatus Woesearchaeota archaeon]|nr:hypothetical protein [Candidatus Woesearchaeota archaeon]
MKRMDAEFILTCAMITAVLGLGAYSLFEKSIKGKNIIQTRVTEFLKETDVGNSAAGLKITSVKDMPRDYIKICAEFSTGRSYHPLDDSEKTHPALPEFHTLEMIIDEKPLSGSSYEVVYARDSNYLGNKSVENGVHAEWDWNYITEKHIEGNIDFNKSTPERDMEFNGKVYQPVTYIKVPELSDWEKGMLSIIGERDGYEIYGIFEERKTAGGTISSVPIPDAIVIPEGGYFWQWSAK